MCLAYADDIVLLAPSWKALQFLLDLLDSSAAAIDMLCNLRKTVCMVFAPKCRSIKGDLVAVSKVYGKKTAFGVYYRVQVFRSHD